MASYGQGNAGGTSHLTARTQTGPLSRQRQGRHSSGPPPLHTRGQQGEGEMTHGGQQGEEVTQGDQQVRRCRKAISRGRVC